MTPVPIPTLLALLSAVAAVLSVTLLVLAIRTFVRLGRVRRVRVPARLLQRRWGLAGEIVDVEYPAPDGSPLRARLWVTYVRAIGLPYAFDGTVWVDPADPTDVTPRYVGRNGWAVTGLVVGTVLLLVAVGLWVAAQAVPG